MSEVSIKDTVLRVQVNKMLTGCRDLFRDVKRLEKEQKQLDKVLTPR